MVDRNKLRYALQDGESGDVHGDESRASVVVQLGSAGQKEEEVVCVRRRL